MRLISLVILFAASFSIIACNQTANNKIRTETIKMPTSNEDVFTLLTSHDWKEKDVIDNEFVLLQLVTKEGEIIDFGKDDEYFIDAKKVMERGYDSLMNDSNYLKGHTFYTQDGKCVVYSFDSDFRTTTRTESRYIVGSKDGVFYYEEDPISGYDVFDNFTNKNITSEYKQLHKEGYYRTYIEDIKTEGDRNLLTMLTAIKYPASQFESFQRFEKKYSIDKVVFGIRFKVVLSPKS